MINQLEIIGEGANEKLAEIVQKYNLKSIFLVRGNRAYKESGAEKIIIKLLQDKTLKITEYYGFSNNPKVEDVEKGLNLLLQSNVEIIIAMGGGSVLDMAKLIRFFHSFKGAIEANHFQQISDTIPLIAIPTTAGSGSEATHFAVVYKNKIKYSVAHPNILPDVVMVDPIFTYETSSYLTACSGFDALAQAIESFWNIYSTAESEEYAKKAISLLWKHLPFVVKPYSEKNDRNAVSEGSFYAGKAINITKTTAPHAFAYPFTTYYNFPHGHAVSLTFPFFIEFNFVKNSSQWNGNFPLEKHQNKMYHLYQLLGCHSPAEAREVMKVYIQNLGLATQLPVSFNKQKIIENINLERLKNNPAKITLPDAFQVIASIVF